MRDIEVRGLVGSELELVKPGASIGHGVPHWTCASEVLCAEIAVQNSRLFRAIGELVACITDALTRERVARSVTIAIIHS